MPTPEQLQKLWDMSDSVLYPEAVTFIRRLVKDEDCLPLPNTQVVGLLNIASAETYSELLRFIRHQCERNWPESKRDIKTLYSELEKWLTTMRNKRVRTEFHLLTEGLTARETNQELDEIMAKLAYDFVQHLVAENALLATQRQSEQRARRR